MSLTLDGSTRYIGTEFIKLEITGSSLLATEAYVNTAVANGGGGGTGTTDLTNYYDKTEVDTLLLNKLNINNPQDMSGTLRIGHIAGTSKIILDAVATDKDFYVNGDAQIGGNMNVFSLDSTGHIQGANVSVSDDVKTNIIDSYGISDITFRRNTFDIFYAKNSSLELNAGINLVAPAQVQANTYNSFDDSSVLLLRNGAEFMRFRKTEDDILVSKDINGTNLEVSGGIKTNTLNSNGVSDVAIKRNDVDIATVKSTGVEVATGLKLITPTLTSGSGTNLVIQRGDFTYMTLASAQVQLGSNITLTGDTLIGDAVHGTDTFANRFRVRHTTSDLTFDGGNVAGNGRTSFMVYRRTLEDLRILNDVLIDNGKKNIV